MLNESWFFKKEFSVVFDAVEVLLDILYRCTECSSPLDQTTLLLEGVHSCLDVSQHHPFPCFDFSG